MEPKYTFSDLTEILAAHELCIPTKLFKDVIENRCDSLDDQQDIISRILVPPVNRNRALEALYSLLTPIEVESINILNQKHPYSSSLYLDSDDDEITGSTKS